MKVKPKKIYKIYLSDKSNKTNRTYMSYKTYLSIFVIFVQFCSFLAFPPSASAATLFRPPNNLGLVGYWPMDEGSGTVVSDASGNGNDGNLLGGASWVSGRRGKALEFNGDQTGSDYRVEVPRNALLEPTTEWTICGWGYKNTYSQTSNGAALLWKGNNTKFSVEFINAAVRVNAGGVWSRLTSSDIPAGIWKLVCVTYDNSEANGELNLYLNDALDKSITGVAEPVHGSENIFIGERGDHLEHTFDGILDDVRLYSRALSLSEISALYRSGQVTRRAPSNTGLAGYWSFNEGRASLARDSSGNGNTGTITGATWVDGKRGKALSFNGSSDYVSTDLSVRNYTQLSVSAWLYYHSTSGYKYTIHQSSNFLVGLYNDQKINWYVRNSSNQSKFIKVPDIIEADRWYHVVGTYDGSVMNLYVNGIFITTSNEVTGIIGAADGFVSIGKDSSASQYFMNGLIDDVRIYNRALSADEVSALYNIGQVVYNAGQNDKLTDGLVGLWSFNGYDISGSTVYDRSGQGHNGTTTSTTKVTQGKVGQALEFDGQNSGDSVDLGNSSALNPSNFTISAWVKVGNAGASYNYIYSNARDCCGAYNGIEFRISYNDLSATIWNNSAAYISTTDDAIPNNSKWLHLVFSYDGSSLKLYIDGINVKTAQSALGVGSPASYNSYIGRMGMGAAYTMDGSIDEVRIYNRALSADEVEQLYLMGK